MAKFRKKPLEVDAILTRDAMSAAWNQWDQLPFWLRDAYELGDVLFCHDHIAITTREGTMRAERNDWIVRGAVGEIYPCKPDAFAASFEPVEVS